MPMLPENLYYTNSKTLNCSRTKETIFASFLEKDLQYSLSVYIIG